MIIDTHSHFVDREYLDALERIKGVATSRGGGWVRYTRDGVSMNGFNEAWLDRDQVLRDADARGIDIRLISLVVPEVYVLPADGQADYARRSNDALIARCRAHPDRLRGVASVPFLDTEAAVAEIGRMRDAPEIVAVQVGSNIDGIPVSDPRFDPIWARINELRMPVIEHPMFPVFAGTMQDDNLGLLLGFMFDTELMLTRMILSGLFARYRDFPFLVAHTGAGVLQLTARLDSTYHRRPDLQERLGEPPSATFTRFYYDTCSFYAPVLEMARSLFGAERLMFGTDFPFVDRGHEYIDALDWPEDELGKVRGAAASDLFGIS